MDKAFDFLTGVVLVVVIAVVVYLIRKEEPKDRQYDERQLALRAEGYKRGFQTAVVAGALAIFLVELEIVPLASATLAMFVAFMIGLVTFAVYCIMRDVFFRVGEKGTYYLGLCAVIVLSDGVAAVVQIVDGSILENGVPTFSGCNALVMALSFLVILVALLIRKYAGERDE